MKPIRKMPLIFVCSLFCFRVFLSSFFFIQTYSSALLIANKEIFLTTNLLVFNWYLLFRVSSFHSLAGMQSFYSPSNSHYTLFVRILPKLLIAENVPILSSTFICTIVGKKRKKTRNNFFVMFSLISWIELRF